LMTHSSITAHLDLFKPAIAWLQANKPDIPYILSEIGNSLNPTHDYAYQAVLGSALWQVDFQLYALSIGVARFNFQQIMHSGFDLWLPQASGTSQPQVFASYYAQPFVTDFVGSSGTAQVAALDIEDESTGNWAGYAAFEDGVPARLAFVNLNYWNSSSSTTARASQNITVSVPDGVTSVTVDLLSSPLGAGGSADSITYAGSQWTYESAGLEVKGVRDDSQALDVVDGSVSIEVYQSSAVLV
ncbi:family 79 glycoside hydrolase, partial [Cryphonectria parasitica EP155]